MTGARPPGPDEPPYDPAYEPPYDPAQHGQGPSPQAPYAPEYLQAPYPPGYPQAQQSPYGAPASQPPPRNRGIVIGAALGLLLAGGLVVAVFLFSGKEASETAEPAPSAPAEVPRQVTGQELTRDDGSFAVTLPREGWAADTEGESTLFPGKPLIQAGSTQRAVESVDAREPEERVSVLYAGVNGFTAEEYMKKVLTHEAEFKEQEQRTCDLPEVKEFAHEGWSGLWSWSAPGCTGVVEGTPYVEAVGDFVVAALDTEGHAVAVRLLSADEGEARELALDLFSSFVPGS